jgi:hypothetical protein
MAGAGLANHYDTLGVTPWAEDSVIRAAYVALMRTYHPDRNKDPEAQARVREITSAFAVLGNPQRRAAYDALGALRKETGIGEDFVEPRPPMRNMGIASVALAVVVSLAFVAWPKVEPPPGPHLHRAAVAKPNPAHVAAAAALPAPAPKVLVQPPSVRPPVSPAPAAKPVAPTASVHEAVLPSPKAPPRRAIAQVAAPRAAPKPTARQVAAVQAAPAPAPPPAVPRADDRRAQVERIANGFLRQSLEHADAYKQQLLMNASSRSAALRAACRSDDCVTNAYLRQIRETTAIVEGRMPNQ